MITQLTPATLCTCNVIHNLAVVLYFIAEDAEVPVAFTVAHNYNRAYGEREIIRFNVSLLNSGGHFQISSSTFICPWNGIYGFFFSIYNTADDYIGCNINHEGEQVSGTFMDNIADAIVQASNMVLLDCDKGDRVFVETGSNEGTIHGSNDRTTFSGFLIHQYD